MYSSIIQSKSSDSAENESHIKALAVLTEMFPIIFPYGTDWEIKLQIVPASTLQPGVEAYTKCSMETTLAEIVIAEEALEGDLLKWLVIHELIELRDMRYYNSFFKLAHTFIRSPKVREYVLDLERESRNRVIEKEVRHILGIQRPVFSLYL